MNMKNRKRDIFTIEVPKFILPAREIDPGSVYTLTVERPMGFGYTGMGHERRISVFSRVLAFSIAVFMSLSPILPVIEMIHAAEVGSDTENIDKLIDSEEVDTEGGEGVTEKYLLDEEKTAENKEEDFKKTKENDQEDEKNKIDHSEEEDGENVGKDKKKYNEENINSDSGEDPKNKEKTEEEIIEEDKEEDDKKEEEKEDEEAVAEEETEGNEEDEDQTKNEDKKEDEGGDGEKESTDKEDREENEDGENAKGDDKEKDDQDKDMGVEDGDGESGQKEKEDISESGGEHSEDKDVLEERLRAELEEEIRRELSEEMAANINDKFNLPGSFKEENCTLLSGGEFYCISDGVVFRGRADRHESITAHEDEFGMKQIVFQEGGHRVRILTKNDVDDISPVYSGESGLVAWQRNINDRWQIVIYDLESDREIFVTDTDYNNVYPEIHDTTVVWQGWVEDGWEIFYIDLSVYPHNKVRLTDDRYQNMEPRVYGDTMVWRSYRDNEWYLVTYTKSTGHKKAIRTGKKNTNPRLVLVWDGVDSDGVETLMHFDPLTKRTAPLASSKNSDERRKPIPNPFEGGSDEAVQTPNRSFEEEKDVGGDINGEDGVE